jgi:hypothetical protein
MASLYADENFDHRVVAELAIHGHAVLTAQAAGNAYRGVNDAAVLAYATTNGRAVLTFNYRHFVRMHLRDPNHAGIIVCTDDRDILALAARIDRAIAAAGPLAGQLIRVNCPPGPRIP